MHSYGLAERLRRTLPRGGGVSFLIVAGLSRGVASTDGDHPPTPLRGSRPALRAGRVALADAVERLQGGIEQDLDAVALASVIQVCGASS